MVVTAQKTQNVKAILDESEQRLNNFKSENHIVNFQEQKRLLLLRQSELQSELSRTDLSEVDFAQADHFSSRATDKNFVCHIKLISRDWRFDNLIT